MDAGPAVDAAVEAAADAGCSGGPERLRTVFITKESFPAKFGAPGGGLEGADAKCTAAAAASPLDTVRGRKYRALLSDTSSALIARMPEGTQIYKRPDCVELQRGEAKVLVGPLLARANITEDGTPASSDAFWSGSQADGVAINYNCYDWTVSESVGAIGSASETDGGWLSTGVRDCSVPAHLVCVEL